MFFAHSLILEYPDHLQILIASSLCYLKPLHKSSSQSVYNFLSNFVNKQTNKQTDRQTYATKNITSFAKEVKIVKLMYIMFTYGDHYARKQASTNCEDAVHICILLCNKVHRVKNDLRCANVCAFLSMLMRVKNIHPMCQAFCHALSFKEIALRSGCAP